MAPDTAAAGENAECEAMGSIDAGQFVIADPCRDDAWLSVPVADARPLPEWR